MAQVLDAIKQDFVPALYAAGSGLAIGKLFLGDNLSDSYPFFGTSLPYWALVGGTIFISDVIGNALQNQVLQLIPNNPFPVEEGKLAKPLITGLATYGIGALSVSPQVSFIRLGGLGAGSAVVGDYLYSILGKGSSM